MVWAVEIRKSEAEPVRKVLLDKQYLDKDYAVKAGEEGSLWLPLNLDMYGLGGAHEHSTHSEKAELLRVELDTQCQAAVMAISDIDMRYKKKKATQEGVKAQGTPASVELALAEILTADECGQLKTAIDVIGDIAVVEVDDETPARLRTALGDAVLKANPRIKVVLKKDGGHSGAFRIQKYSHVAGDNRTLTTCSENSIRLTLDVATTYYSPRSSAERKRVAALVRAKERVCVMFCGVGPYICVIGRLSACSSVVGVEMNTVAAEFANLNIKKNKLQKTCSVLVGDVREVFPPVHKSNPLVSADEVSDPDLPTNRNVHANFDRIVMPMPHMGDSFLDVALPLVSPVGGWLHVYYFSTDEEVNLFTETIPRISLEYGRQTIPEKPHRCGNLGPKIYRWCIDVRVLPI
ncbi:hypothetical protein SARC_05649 [Sphaeroforma arctica JP610]|uniref:SAM-dependent methyltransferase TRM5/TYW2-type domain-containing protein n=1 Tax=Sphaeroforma arctica JP610 TaxID=667725 RepID=A0A0L0FZ01_9EUKA|nr:hypothetical protein SARC_05649 [Sphaeroforma arctica JP610]KNC82055.1 hypothetical protein SARC_05649 [Sphaeroforma arctica JP610]|eukprot:XP_014155957.1 hypothetical protein SARC_05649 [Sphaeroforma arctica JP610]